jgi:Lipid A 3-O-deacylase (PagL)
MKAIILLLAMVGSASAAELNLSLGTITHPSANNALLRLETRFALPSEWLTPISENLSSYWQANGNLWHAEQTHYAIGTGIGARYQFNERWSLELGWGVTLLDERFISPGYDMGSQLHFETTLGIRYQLPPTSALRLNVYHWSNAHLSDINPGCEIVMLGYQFNY